VKLGLAIEELHRAENHLHRVLLAVSDRHRADTEVFFVARDIARWSQRHVAELARIGADFGVGLDPEATAEPGVLERLQQTTADLLRHRPEPGLLLLADLRHVHREAAGVSLDWELLAQAAQGSRQAELFGLARRCHPDTLRQMRWANAKLKESATQVLVS
jgi:sugar phosphate isomerase/epimerase